MSVLEKFARNNNGLRDRRDRPLFKPKSAYISDDSYIYSLFSRQRDIMSHMLGPTTRPFSFDGSGGLPFNQRAPIPKEQSSESLASNESAAPDWDRTQLLDLSDLIRTGLRHGNITSPDAGKISNFLETTLKDEERKCPTLDFATIEYARLDKLLAEILLFADTVKPSELTPEILLRLRVIVSQAKNLRRLWRRRFREQFFMLDQHRCAVLVDGGRLKDISFNSSLDYDLGKWQATKASGPVSEVEANLQFEPGHWWLNITCAERDGIVSSSLEAPTKGCYGVTALPLLTGSEESIQPDTVKYVRRGRTSDMHVPLISQVGRKIRILRGHKLKSIFAPEAGLRYDGLYTIRQYGFKFDNDISMYKLELTLERAANQRSFEDIRKVPKPSQLDDWALYEKLEGDKVKLMQGESSFLEWKLKRHEEQAEHEEWQRATRFRASFSRKEAGGGERVVRRAAHDL